MFAVLMVSSSYHMPARQHPKACMAGLAGANHTGAIAASIQSLPDSRVILCAYVTLCALHYSFRRITIPTRGKEWAGTPAYHSAWPHALFDM